MWQEQMLNPVLASGLWIQLPSNTTLSPLDTGSVQASSALYPALIPFVHQKSSADARGGKQANVSPQTGTESSTWTCITQGMQKAAIFPVTDVITHGPTAF